MKTLFIQLSLVTVILGGLFLGALHFSQPSVVLAAYSPTGGGTYRLGQSIGTTDSSFRLSSFKEPVSNIPYTMSYINTDIVYATISPQSSISEFVSFSGITQNSDGSATLTGVVRGISRTPGTGGCVASTTLSQAHAGQSILILSNPPCQLAEYIPLRTVATSSATLIFGSTTPPHYDSVGAQANGSAISTTSEFASVAYVNAVAIAGVSNASETVKGISELATSIETASSTALGATGAGAVLQAKYASSTYSPGMNLNIIPVTNLLGVLSPQFIATSSTSVYNFGGSMGYTGSTTYSGTGTTTIFSKLQIAASSLIPLWLNGLAYQFSTARGASSTVLTEDGAGNVGFQAPNMRLLIATTTQQNMTFATTTFSGQGLTQIKIVMSIAGTSGANSLSMYFNSDRNTNYGSSYTDDGVITKSSASNGINLSNLSTTSPALVTMDIFNQTSTRKLLNWNMGYSATAAQSPSITIGQGVWNNTSSQINSMVFYIGGANTITAGTVIAVYGSNY